MSDFDPDAYLDGETSPAFDPDAYLHTKPAAAGAPPKSAMGVVNSAASGMNSGAYDLLGAPMDFATNTSNLLKAGIGYPYSKLTGKAVPGVLQPDDPANVVGTSAWLKRKTREAGGGNLIDAPAGSDPTLVSIPHVGNITVHDVGEMAGPAPFASAAGKAGSLTRLKGAPPTSAQAVLDKIYQDSPQSMGAAAAAPNISHVSPEMQQAITRAAQKNGGALNPEATARHLEAQSLPVPVYLTEGQALQEPSLISHEQNLRLKHPELASHFDSQNKALGKNITAIRDRIGPEVFSTNSVEHADTLIKSYVDKGAEADAKTGAAYQALRDANGGAFPVDAPQLYANVANSLHQKLLFEHAPKQLTQLEGLAKSGKMTFEQFEALRTNLARTMRSSSDANEVAAAGVIRSEMEKLPLQGEAAQLKPLADTARGLARQQFEAVEADPAYKAALNGKVSPDRFVQKFVTGPQAARDDVALMRQNLSHDPVALQTMGVAALDHLRDAAVLNTAGEGNFAAASFNKALTTLEPRLRSLVDPKATEDLSTLGSVSRYTTFQPRGSAVNNSNTFVAAAGAHAANALEGAANLKAGGFPVGTIGRKILQKRADKKAVQKMIEPGAGMGRLSEVGKP